VRSGRKRGGRKDHPGATRALVEDPEHRIVVPLEGLCSCGRDCAELTVEVLPERRQVIDLVVRREVTEYRTVTGVCACGEVHRSAFPDALGAPVQYGPGLSALAVVFDRRPKPALWGKGARLNDVALQPEI
jgi:transposase